MDDVHGNDSGPAPSAASNRLLLERIELAKRFDDVDARRWRNATDAERAATLESLLDYVDCMRRALPGGLPDEPRLMFPRLPALRR